MDLNENSASAPPSLLHNPNVRETSKLLEALEQALNTIPALKTKPNPTGHNCALQTLVNDDQFNTHVKFTIQIESAGNLSIKKPRRRGKNGKWVKRIDAQPNTYVTFEYEGKSGEFFTNVAMRTTNPKWSQTFHCDMPIDMLIGNTMPLVFKLWYKQNESTIHPNPSNDTVIGVVSTNLTLLTTKPTVDLTLDIIDPSEQPCGQLHVKITRLTSLDSESGVNPLDCQLETMFQMSTDQSTAALLTTAFKRKMCQLDDISKRLKNRLNQLTDNVQFDGGSDDEFERDIRSVCEDGDDKDGGNVQSELTDGQIKRQLEKLAIDEEAL